MLIIESQGEKTQMLTQDYREGQIMLLKTEGFAFNGQKLKIPS